MAKKKAKKKPIRKNIRQVKKKTTKKRRPASLTVRHGKVWIARLGLTESAEIWLKEPKKRRIFGSSEWAPLKSDDQPSGYFTTACVEELSKFFDLSGMRAWTKKEFSISTFPVNSK